MKFDLPITTTTTIDNVRDTNDDSSWLILVVFDDDGDDDGDCDDDGNCDSDVPLLLFSLGCLDDISISLMKQKTVDLAKCYAYTERRTDTTSYRDAETHLKMLHFVI